MVDVIVDIACMSHIGYGVRLDTGKLYSWHLHQNLFYFGFLYVTSHWNGFDIVKKQ